jgi:hypothetical protein
VKPWLDPACFGSPGLDPRLAGPPEAHLRRVMNRVKHAAEKPNGLYRDVVAIRDRARERGELARQIGEALQARDMASARRLIEEAAATFGHKSMLAAVQERAQQDRLEAMSGPDDISPEYEDDPEPYDMELEWDRCEPR